MGQTELQMVLATRNSDKAAELKAILGNLGIETVALNELDPHGDVPDIDEVGSSLKENALIKAREVFAHTRRPTIADDTGLEVDALKGAPGIYSARYAGKGCSYEDNIRKLLSELESTPPASRTARFRTVVCYVDGDQELCAEGIVEGLIKEKPLGDQGFGYDPVFYIPECNKTYAQLSSEEKNYWSHRGKAVRQLITLLSDDLIPTEHPSLKS